MTIFDRYVLQLYIKVLVVWLLSLYGLYVVIDGFNNSDEFLAYGKKHAGGALAVVAEYYGPRLLWFFDRTAGLLAMTSVAFVVTLLQRTNELTALMAAGISPSRMLRPLLGASIFVALLGMANREFGLPRVRDSLSRNAQDWLGENGRKCNPTYDNRNGVLIQGKATYAKDRRIAEPAFPLPSGPLVVAWGRQIKAENAFHQPASADRPAGFLLRGVQQPANLAKLPSVSLDGEPVLLSPADTPGLAPDECFVVSVVTFEQLAIGAAWRQNLSSYELVTGIRGNAIESAADVRLMLHARVVQPLLDVALVLLGIPLVLSRGSRNIFMAAAIGGGLVAGVMVVAMACHALGANYLLSATLAAWLPLLIFGPIAYTIARPLWD